VEPGDRLKLLIRASGKSQAQIAREIDEHAMWVSNRVTGHSQINVQDVEKIATSLGWDECQWFLALIGRREPYPSRDPTPSRGLRFATRWADLIDQAIPDDDAEAEQLELALLRKMLEVKERRLSQKG
jgi:transcriptional regulator with XRE-family HTH domain